MRECFDTLAALGAYLRAQQECRAQWVSFTLKGQRTDAQLHQALDMLLPMVQRSSRRVWRERGGHRVTMTLRYRDGVRMADAYRSGDRSALTLQEQAALARAETIVQEHDTLEKLQGYLAEHVTYENPRVGARYSQIVGCVCALEEGGANCQGISDAMYLLGTLAGYPMGYQQGWNQQGAHLWNTVQIRERTWALDATYAVVHGAGEPVLLNAQACRMRGLRWEKWAETAEIVLD